MTSAIDKIFLTDDHLAHRWGRSLGTLCRWRRECDLELQIAKIERREPRLDRLDGFGRLPFAVIGKSHRLYLDQVVSQWEQGKLGREVVEINIAGLPSVLNSHGLGELLHLSSATVETYGKPCRHEDQLIPPRFRSSSWHLESAIGFVFDRTTGIERGQLRMVHRSQMRAATLGDLIQLQLSQGNQSSGRGR